MEELANINMVKEPFRSYTLDADKEESASETLTIRINKEERERLERLKYYFSYGADAKILKRALIVLENVTLHTFGIDLIKEISEERRRRPVNKFKVEGGILNKM